MGEKNIKSALISVFHKDGLEEVVRCLKANNVTIYSTGGTQSFIEKLGIDVIPVEELTSYPSILGGRVKTLHPKVFGGILSRREENGDVMQLEEYSIPEIDLVIVDLYPFENTVASGAPEQDIIEKIDIGGISLIRAAAKNFKDVLIVSDRSQYSKVVEILDSSNGATSIEQRRHFAMEAFNVSSHYDTAIYNYFGTDSYANFKQSISTKKELRYGENPHQKGFFYGELDALFDQLNGKELSYNNLLDIDAAVSLIDDFEEITFAILKHNNACGIASRATVEEAWKDALAGDPVSAFGGILITNATVTKAVSEEIAKLFYEVIIAPSYDEEALAILKEKKKRVILKRKECKMPSSSFRTLLNGVILQDKDLSSQGKGDLEVRTTAQPSAQETDDLLFANKIVKHTKSNCIVLAKNKQLLASGVGQTSRVDALKQAIHKAGHFNFELKGAVMASDAFFPFPDCVEIAHNAGVKAVVQPGGSIKDKDSIDYCNSADMAMVFTGVRHFKH